MRFCNVFFIILFATLVTSLGYAQDYNSGEPGCLRAVGSRAISDPEFERLTPKCQSLRKNYLKAATQLVENPKEFKKALTKSIQVARQSKTKKPPYDALLFSVITLDFTQTKAIADYAEKEKQKKARYLYGAAALERLNTGECKNFTDPAYFEICKGVDPALKRLALLNQAKEQAKGARR